MTQHSTIINLTKKINTLNVFCFIVLLLCINSLNRKSKRVFYENQIRNSELNSISVCVEIKKYDCSRLGDLHDSLQLCEYMNEYFDTFYKNEKNLSVGYFISYILFSPYRKTQLSYHFHFVPMFQMYNVYYNYHHICIVYYNSSQPDFLTLTFENKAKLSTTLFLNDDYYGDDVNENGIRDTRSSFVNDVFLKYECDDFISCPGVLLTGVKIKLNYLEAPYETMCIDYGSKEFPFSKDSVNVVKIEKIVSNSDCRNECLKTKYNSKYFYYSFEKNVQLVNLSREESLVLSNDVYKESLAYCAKYCSNPNCVNYFHADSLVSDHLPAHLNNTVILELEPGFAHRNARPLFPAYSFWLHFLSLFGCIFGLSFLNVFDFFGDLFRTNFGLKEDSDGSRTIEKIKWLIVIILNVFFTVYLFILLDTNQNQTEFKHEAYNNTKFKLNLCYPLFKSLKDTPYLDEVGLTFDEHLNFDTYLNLTLGQLNTRTFGLEHLFNDHELFNKPKISYFFKNKCFQFEIDFGKNDKLSYNTTVNPFTFYLIPSDQVFNSLTPKLMSHLVPMVSFEKRTAKCVDYRKMKYDSSVCFSKKACVDRCYLNEYVKKHNALPFSLIQEDDFLKYEHLRFRNIFDSDLKAKCLRKFSAKPCDEVRMYRSSHSAGADLGAVNFEDLTVFKPVKAGFLIHKDSYYWTDLFIDLFNLYTCLGLVNLLISNFKANQTNHAVSIMMKILCTLLFMLHLYTILASLEDVFRSSYYKNDARNEDIPSINICVNLKDKMIMNYFNLQEDNLTEYGHEFEEKTKQIKIENIVDRIEYINMNYKLRNDKPAKAKYSTSWIGNTIEVSYFYLKNRKCISLKYSIDPKNIRLHLVEYLLSIKFKTELKGLNYELLLMHQQSKPKDLELFKELKFDRSYRVKLMIVREQFLDSFDTVSHYTIERMKVEYLKRTNFTTTELPLTEEYNVFKINDELFKESFKRSLDKRFKGTSHSLYEPKFWESSKDEYNLRIRKDILRNMVRHEMKKNFTAFFIEVLNSTSTWYNLCLFDLICLFTNNCRLVFGMKKKSSQVKPS